MILYTLWTLIGDTRVGYANETTLPPERLSSMELLLGEQIRSFSFWLGKDGDPN